MQGPEVTIIGLGRLGQSLARALTEAGLSVKSIFTRSQSPTTNSFDITGSFPTDKSQLGKLVFITVSDRAIADVSRRLAALSGDFSSYTFVHCSGSEPAGLLEDLHQKEAVIASFHPLQTFTHTSGAGDFEEIFFSMQGNKAAFSLLQRIAEKVGARAFEVSREQKTLLHTAAVMASNYLITLLESSVETGAAGGLSKAQVKQALFPLIQTTLQNSREGSFREVLTGPIMRGDAETVKTHMSLIEDHPQLREIYAVMGRKTVEAAVTSGTLQPGPAEKLRKVLTP